MRVEGFDPLDDVNSARATIGAPALGFGPPEPVLAAAKNGSAGLLSRDARTAALVYHYVHGTLMHQVHDLVRRSGGGDDEDSITKRGRGAWKQAFWKCSACVGDSYAAQNITFTCPSCGQEISTNYDSPLGILFSSKPNRYFRRSFCGYPLPGGKQENSNAQYFDTTHHSECHVKCGRRLKLAALSGRGPGGGGAAAGGAVSSRAKSTREKKQTADQNCDWLFYN